MKSTMKFWAYKLRNGQIKPRRWFSDGDVTEARGSSFVDEVMEPFDATGWPDAEKQIKAYFEKGN